MKQLVIALLSCIILTTFTGCATIVGGSNYYAKVIVRNHPKAQIEHNGMMQGTGVASFMTKRSLANRFSITVKEEGCEPQTFHYTQRVFRGWAFVGTVVFWTGIITPSNVPLPFGVVVDAATGALWKPSEHEKGVMKVDYDNFVYAIEYTGCEVER